VIEREDITVVCSKMGWIRAMRGHSATDAAQRAAIKYKEGDEEGFILDAETTDKILLFATNGRFYTLSGDKLPPGRGFGEPVRLMTDLPNEDDIIGMTLYAPEQKFVVAANDGRGFIVKAEDVLAQTKNGKQILNVGEGVKAAVFAPALGDTIAVIGTNRKMLLFPIAELPEMSRGRGVILQKYSGGKLSDVKAFVLKDGLTWQSGDRTRTESDLRNWKGARAQAGRIAPNGFNRSNKFK